MDQWSFSRLKIYEECPFRIKLKYIEKIPEPEPPPEAPVHRGNRLHAEAEQFVRGDKEELSIELQRNYKDAFEELSRLFADNQVTVENECAIDRDWVYVPGWQEEKAWGILKMDAEVYDPKTTFGRVIDYKSGKVNWKHGEQLQFYQTVFLAKHPECSQVTTELWYLDFPAKPVAMKFTRKQGQKFIKGIKKRALKMCNDEEFKPNPNTYSCRFCPYGPGKTYDGQDKLGICQVGVEVYS